MTPRPVADIDARLREGLRDYHRARWVSLTGAVAVLAAAVIVLGVLYIGQDARLRASCDFWKVLAPAPVGNTPGSARPSRLSILLITASREAYAGQGCGEPPPADPTVRRGAAFYHIRVP